MICPTEKKSGFYLEKKNFKELAGRLWLRLIKVVFWCDTEGYVTTLKEFLFSFLVFSDVRGAVFSMPEPTAWTICDKEPQVELGTKGDIVNGASHSLGN